MRSALDASGSHPAAPERDTPRVAQVVTHFCITTLSLGGSYVLLSWIMPSLGLRRDLLTLFAILSYAIPLLLLRLGRTTLASYLVWILTWLVVTSMAFTNGGLAAPVVVHYLLLMLTTALLSQGRTLWLAFEVGLLGIVGLGLLGQRGLLPPPVSSTSHIPRMISMLLAMAWLAVMLRTTLSQLRHALVRAEKENVTRRETEAELRKTEAELRALNERLETRVAERTTDLSEAKEAALAASHAKSTFLATMSHELRTPVAGIVGLIELLGRCELPADARSMLGPLLSSSKTLLALIGDVLDYSKIEAGRLEIERIVMNPRSVLDEVLLLLRPNAEQHGLKLDLVVEDAVPSYILCDPTRLQQIVLNLVGNAIKFTPSGSVRVQLGHRDDVLTLSVKDTGIGIAREVQAQLFHPFVQADPSTTRKYGGSGLGLLITRRLALLLDGDVTVESELGVGSTFTCTVHAKAAARPKHEPESPPGPQRPLCILLAEDNDINAFIVTTLLAHLGHTCDRVSDGGQAVEHAKQRRYDAILMDMHMPMLDGPEATQQIRALPGAQGRVPIIGLSADALSEHEAEYVAAGLTAYLTKPCTVAQLQQVLSTNTASPA